MLVVADSSPLIVMVSIGHVGVLPRLFGQVVIPPEVVAELQQGNRPDSVREFIARRPSWLIERSPTFVETIPGLHQGELAAIGLARELKADLLLIDEVAGRKAAAERGLALTGTTGVLELGAEKGFLDLREAFEQVKGMDFWISHALLDERLKLHLARQR